MAKPAKEPVMKSPLLFAGVLTLVAALSLSGESMGLGQEGDLTGVYACEGIGPGDASYHGKVQIIRRENTYELQWTFDSSPEQYVGIGLVNGDVLAVSYFGGVPGVVLYRIEQTDSGPRLTGHWTVIESVGRVFQETLTRVATEVSDPPPARPHRTRSPRPSGRSV
jgi:hypothetical protein